MEMKYRQAGGRAERGWGGFEEVAGGAGF